MIGELNVERLKELGKEYLEPFAKNGKKGIGHYYTYNINGEVTTITYQFISKFISGRRWELSYRLMTECWDLKIYEESSNLYVSIMVDYDIISILKQFMICESFREGE